ncbi:hypothetical protein Y1Q_0009834 [Alligator mississippiensis]|uniref:Uncharacterized protein n=1 Tax=Alligator mississippiensis TaxID=8496 RepID=A0A151MWU4_ALLMI|nr:hypothetical protein Y1Q_0009834 [Alligator mississippiensis]
MPAAALLQQDCLDEEGLLDLVLLETLGNYNLFSSASEDPLIQLSPCTGEKNDQTSRAARQSARNDSRSVGMSPSLVAALR